MPFTNNQNRALNDGLIVEEKHYATHSAPIVEQGFSLFISASSRSIITVLDFSSIPRSFQHLIPGKRRIFRPCTGSTAQTPRFVALISGLTKSLNECQEDVWSDIRIATHPDERTGRNGTQLSVSPLKMRSLELGLETHLIPREKAAFKFWEPPSQFLHSPPSTSSMLITASFGRMIPDRILHLFPVSRRLNVHPSLVPKYRGPAPIQHAVADGTEETGVCILEMKEKKLGADVGEVWARKVIASPPRPAFSDLRATLATEGGLLLVSVLRSMMAGTAVATPQDVSGATHAPFITQETATIDFSTWDAHKLDRMYRAIGHQRPITTSLPSLKRLQLFAPQPYTGSSETSELPKPLRALRSPGDTTYDPTTRMLAIRCAGDTFVYVPSVKQQDKKQLPAQEWWKGVWPEWLNNKVMKLGHEVRES